MHRQRSTEAIGRVKKSPKSLLKKVTVCRKVTSNSEPNTIPITIGATGKSNDLKNRPIIAKKSITPTSNNVFCDPYVPTTQRIPMITGRVF
jgi:hypothetical protein